MISNIFKIHGLAFVAGHRRIMAICSLVGIEFLILSMITPGTHYLAIALTAIVIGQVFTILVLRDRNKEKQE